MGEMVGEHVSYSMHLETRDNGRSRDSTGWLDLYCVLTVGDINPSRNGRAASDSTAISRVFVWIYGGIAALRSFILNGLTPQFLHAGISARRIGRERCRTSPFDAFALLGDCRADRLLVQGDKKVTHGTFVCLLDYHKSSWK